MASQWTLSEKLAGAPQRIRPETHWFQETTQKGRDDGALWFSLQLTPDRANQLYEWNLDGAFGELIKSGARMAPSSRTALKYTLDRGKSGTIGTDILVPKKVFAAFEALSTDGIEISDAGLAVAGEIGVEGEDLAVTNETAKSTPGPLPKDSPVIIAIIDDGIGIANHRFRQSATKTRVKHFLDLAVIGTPTARPLVDELLGRSWKGSDIDKLLGHDEEQVYRALGLIDLTKELRQPLRAAVTHGTHMLDLAAGYDWRTEAAIAKKRPIIAVQLPTQVAENRSDTWLPQSLKRALDWILVKADELSDELSPEYDPDSKKKKRLPLIVNGSFASMAGPQDGCSDVEKRITQFIKTYRGDGPKDLCTFVLSAGNSLQLRSAAQMDIPRGCVGEIPWRVLPDDKTPSFVEIWLPRVDDGVCSEQPQVQVSLVPPRDGPETGMPLQLGGAVEWKIGEDAAARIYHQRFPRSGGSRECITIAIRPTADDQESGPVVVASGLWRIRIKNIAQQALKNIDLRVHRDDVGMFSRSGARQSYFDHPEYEMFEPSTGRIINDEEQDSRGETRVTRQGTLSTYAYAEGVLVVGGYRRSDGEPAAYSSSGRHENPRKDADGNPVDGPDLAAVSEESPALAGVLAAGTYSGSVAIMNGTSVAAPQVVRALADQIAKRGNAELVAGKTAVTELKTAVAAEEQKAEGEQKDAVAAPGRGHSKQRHELRFGVGRLSFKSSYPNWFGGLRHRRAALDEAASDRDAALLADRA
jgi:hypothetical protein